MRSAHGCEHPYSGICGLAADLLRWPRGIDRTEYRLRTADGTWRTNRLGARSVGCGLSGSQADHRDRLVSRRSPERCVRIFRHIAGHADHRLPPYDTDLPARGGPFRGLHSGIVSDGFAAPGVGICNAVGRSASIIVPLLIGPLFAKLGMLGVLTAMSSALL